MRRAAKPQATWPESIPSQGLQAFRVMFRLLTEILPQIEAMNFSKVFKPYLAISLRKTVRLRLSKGYGKGMRVLDTTDAQRWEQCQRRVAIVKKQLSTRRDRFDPSYPLFRLFRMWARAELRPIRYKHYTYKRKTVYSQQVTVIPRYRSRLSRSVKDIASLMEYGYTVSELVKLASMGDMESLFQLIALDKCFLTAKLMEDWIRRVHSLDDMGFFQGLSKAVLRDTYKDHRASVRLGVACYLLWFLGFKKLTNRDLLAFLESERLVHYDDPLSFDRTLRRLGLRRYKIRQGKR